MRRIRTQWVFSLACNQNTACLEVEETSLLTRLRKKSQREVVGIESRGKTPGQRHPHRGLVQAPWCLAPPHHSHHALPGPLYQEAFLPFSISALTLFPRQDVSSTAVSLFVILICFCACSRVPCSQATGVNGSKLQGILCLFCFFNRLCFLEQF